MQPSLKYHTHVCKKLRFTFWRLLIVKCRNRSVVGRDDFSRTVLLIWSRLRHIYVHPLLGVNPVITYLHISILQSRPRAFIFSHSENCRSHCVIKSLWNNKPTKIATKMMCQMFKRKSVSKKKPVYLIYNQGALHFYALHTWTCAF